MLVLKVQLIMLTRRWGIILLISEKNYGINFSHGMCFNKMIHPPRLCEEKRMIIAQLKDLLLVKCGLYAIDGLTMSNIDLLSTLKLSEVYILCTINRYL